MIGREIIIFSFVEGASHTDYPSTAHFVCTLGAQERKIHRSSIGRPLGFPFLGTQCADEMCRFEMVLKASSFGKMEYYHLPAYHYPLTSFYLIYHLYPHYHFYCHSHTYSATLALPLHYLPFNLKSLLSLSLSPHPFNRLPLILTHTSINYPNPSSLPPPPPPPPLVTLTRRSLPLEARYPRAI